MKDSMYVVISKKASMNVPDNYLRFLPDLSVMIRHLRRDKEYGPARWPHHYDRGT